MGALSFGVSEILKKSAEGWFKLLTQEEGEFYNVPVPPAGTDVAAIRHQMKSKFNSMMPSGASRQDSKSPSAEVAPLSADHIPHNMGKQDVIRASDFNYIMVLGKGSFGKVININ